MINHRAQPADDSPHEGVSRGGNTEDAAPRTSKKLRSTSYDHYYRMSDDRRYESEERLYGATGSFHRDDTQLYSPYGARTRARRPEY